MSPCWLALRKSAFTTLAIVLLVLGTTAPTYAAGILFDFNALADAANSAAIQTYMQGVVNAALGGSHTVAVGAGAVADKYSYKGDNHVTGPGTGSVPVTLGNSEGCAINGPGCVPGSPDTFVRNIGGDVTQTPNDRITLNFDFVITSVSFDYEIFPDGSTSQPPDFIFQATNSSNVVQSTWTQLGITPGTGGTWANSPLGAPDPNAQRLGVWSGTFLATLGVKNLNFIDWPATIGIDNLCINGSCTGGGGANPVPEPGTMILLGTGVASAYWRKKKAARKPQV